MNIGTLRALALALGILWAPTPSYAQEPADRAALQVYRTSLVGKAEADLASEVRRLQALRNPSPRDQLQLAFAILALGQASRSDTDLLKAINSLGKLVEQHPDWPEAWLGLGLTRAALADRRTIAREGPLQPLGMSFAAGAAPVCAWGHSLHDSGIVGSREAAEPRSTC